MKPLIVFDMDGVLAEVTESYRMTIIETVRHFTGVEIEPAAIQAYKNRGGFNNDFLVSQVLCRDAGREVRDEDDPAVVGERPGGQGPGDRLGEVEHTDILQRFLVLPAKRGTD